jgi:NAD+ kinase
MKELPLFLQDPTMSLPNVPIKRIGVFALKGDLTTAVGVLRAFAEDHKDVRVFLSPFLKPYADRRLTVKSEAYLQKNVDIILSLGGDGTFLSAARLVRSERVPILGVNLGRLGFMADATLENLRRILEEIMNNDYTLRSRMLLKVDAYHGRRRLFQDIALNEVAFTGVMGRQMVEMSVTANGKFVSDYRVDGLLVSTPTGSTAYNLSAGGPIVHPSTNALLLTPMNPASLSVRPVVVADTIQLDVRNTMAAGEELHVHVDGRNRGTLPPGAEIRIYRNSQGIRIIRPLGSSYFGSLRNKLGWTGSRDGRR